MFSLGRDIRLKPAQKGDPLDFFIYPYAELDGKPASDSLKNEYSFRRFHPLDASAKSLHRWVIRYQQPSVAQTLLSVLLRASRRQNQKPCSELTAPYSVMMTNSSSMQPLLMQ